jgi:4-amino-4-deoxy-L-arabinose transferase-like glycosyltransferase
MQTIRMAAPEAPPGRTIALGLLLFALVWLGLLNATSLSPPTDDIEQLTWVRSLEWGYYKHPPLPTWLMWLPVRIFGLSAWVPYALGAACTLAAMGVMWHLVARLRGATHASVALLAALCITYYNGRLYYYNHNVVLLLLSSVSAWLCWQAFATRRMRWWVALGVVLGLGALTKYQIAVTVVSVLAFAVHQRAWRDQLHRQGALLACLIALVIFVPHIEWLTTHDFSPITYALESSLGAHFTPAARIEDSATWLADQLLNRALPALLLLVAVARRPGTATSQEPALPHTATHDRGAAKALLLAWGLAPLAFMVLVGLSSGADLQLQWGTPFLLFVVPAAMELWPREAWQRADLSRALGAFLVIQSLLLAHNFVTSPRGPAALRKHYWHTFDSAELAARIADPAHAQLGGPVRVVVGPASVAGALALRLPERPRVLIDGRQDRSPWVALDLIERCGAVELGAAGTLANAAPLGAAFPGMVWRVVLPTAAAGACPADRRLDYAVALINRSGEVHVR